MSSKPNGARRIATSLRAAAVDSIVCRSCQESFSSRNYTTTVATSALSKGKTISNTSGSFEASIAPNHPVLKPTYTVKAGVVLSRPPQITRDLTGFEKSFFFYQRRLNERLALPFTRYFYFKRGTPADEDWKRKYKDRQTAARDIGNYNAYSKEAWNDELLVGAIESETEHQVDMLLQDAETTAMTTQEGAKKEEIQRPSPRKTEADEKSDQKRLDRLLQRTLYLLVQSKDGRWKFPSSSVEPQENLRTAAERTLSQSTGVNMNTWFVGYHPVGHYILNFRNPVGDEQTSIQLLGEKTFFIKSRIMAGQVDLSANSQDLQDFKWLAKEEIEKFVRPSYFNSVRNMLSNR